MIDLLQPRFIVTNDYPDSPFKIHDIISFEDYHGKLGHFLFKGEEFEQMYSLNYFKPHPHLFRPLHWLEFLKEEDKPMYVRLENGEIRKVKSYACGEQIAEYYDGKEGLTTFLLPATETEYNNFINQEK